MVGCRIHLQRGCPFSFRKITQACLPSISHWVSQMWRKTGVSDSLGLGSIVKRIKIVFKYLSSLCCIFFHIYFSLSNISLQHFLPHLLFFSLSNRKRLDVRSHWLAERILFLDPFSFWKNLKESTDSFMVFKFQIFWFFIQKVPGCGVILVENTHLFGLFRSRHSHLPILSQCQLCVCGGSIGTVKC